MQVRSTHITERITMNQQPAEPTFTGVVLAGGRSRRMGRDKCFLLWEQQPLWLHMQQKLWRAGAARVIVCGAPSGSPSSVHCWADVRPGLGPLGGLLTLATRAADGIFLVVPVDMPALDSQWLQPMVEVLLQCGDSTLCACYVEHPLPLAIRLNSVSRRVIAEASAGAPRARSLRNLCAALQAEYLPLPASDYPGLSNCNTPAQWQMLCADMGMTSQA